MTTQAGKLRQQVEIFFAAVRYFTQLPVPSWVGHSQAHLEAATRYFTLIGALVGLACFVVFIVLAQILPARVAVVGAMLATILLTGAFHEDGFADACDGFGGGWERQRILEIMKDPHLGAFGAVGLMLILLLKFELLVALVHLLVGWHLALAWALIHASSRLAAIGVMYLAPYARDDLFSKAKPIAQQPSQRNFWLALLWPIILLIFAPNPYYWLLLLPTALCAGISAHYFKKRLGGYTGDCLGATQQVCEVILYASLLMLVNV